MCKKRLPRWISILTGVAVCALLCVYTTSNSWAAMCMVGYDNSACSGKYNPPKPNDKGGGEEDSCCDGSAPPCSPDNTPPCVVTDCERLGFSERGAKPNTDYWPKKAMIGTTRNTTKWFCSVCDKNGVAIRDRSGYAYYNCYLRCQNEAEATNIEGGSGKITNWSSSGYSPNSTISRPKYNPDTNAGSARIYRDQFVRSQAECNVLFPNAKTNPNNGKTVPESKFYWVTRNVCGQCSPYRCFDSAEIIDGCYKPCEQTYNLEDGTSCCKEKELKPMDAIYHPYTVSAPNACYVENPAQTAWGAAKGLGETSGYCYTKRECDICTELNGECQCVYKSCDTYANELGKPVYSSSKFAKGENEPEKVSGILGGKCLTKKRVNCSENTEFACYEVELLQCPNGEPDSDCGCGVGCPPGTLTEAEVNSSSYKHVINLEARKDGSGNDKQYCLAIEGSTCTEWSMCYDYNICENVADDNDSSKKGFLVSDGDGSCTCGNGWKTGPGACDNSQDTANIVSLTNAAFTQHSGSTVSAGDIKCFDYPGVTCNNPFDYSNPLAQYPYETSTECYCYCDADRGWTNDEDVNEGCIIGDVNTTEASYSWVDNGNTERQGTCWYHNYDVVSCPSGTHLVTNKCTSTEPEDHKKQCECNSGTTVSGTSPADADKPANTDDTIYSYSVDHATYTNQDGDTIYISCYYSGDVTCEDDEILTTEGCKKCSAGYATESNAGCNCAQEFSVQETIEGKNGGKLECGICENKAAQGCPSTYYASNDPALKSGSTNDWWCTFTSVSCQAFDGEGHDITCYSGATHMVDTCTMTESELIADGYMPDECAPGQQPDKECTHACTTWRHCVAAWCPNYTSCTNSSDFVPTGYAHCTAASEGGSRSDGNTYGFCKNSNGDLCANSVYCQSEQAWRDEGKLK